MAALVSTFVLCRLPGGARCGVRGLPCTARAYVLAALAPAVATRPVSDPSPVGVTTRRRRRQNERGNMNSVNIIGRLTRDPELRETPTGTAVCSLRLAYEQSSPNEQTGFVDVTCWGATAKAVAAYLSQGDQVGVTGELR